MVLLKLLETYNQKNYTWLWLFIVWDLHIFVSKQFCVSWSSSIGLILWHTQKSEKCESVTYPRIRNIIFSILGQYWTSLIHMTYHRASKNLLHLRPSQSIETNLIFSYFQKSQLPAYWKWLLHNFLFSEPLLID